MHSSRTLERQKGALRHPEPNRALQPIVLHNAVFAAWAWEGLTPLRSPPSTKGGVRTYHHHHPRPNLKAGRDVLRGPFQGKTEMQYDCWYCNFMIIVEVVILIMNFKLRTITLHREFRTIILRNRLGDLGHLGQAGGSNIAKQSRSSCPCPTCSPTSLAFGD